MAGALPRVGTVSYGSHTFSATLKLTVSFLPEYDEATRSVVRIHGHAEIEDVVSAVTPGTDSTFQTIERTLTQVGSRLVIRGQGCGNIEVNNSSQSTADLNFGPKPGPVIWTPIGSAQACMLNWSVDFWISPCTSTVSSANLLAYNYSVTHTADAIGFWTRTVQGYLEVFSRRSGTAPTVSADQFRQRVNVALPTGFQRTQSWDLSPDKTKLAFSIVDTQIRTRNAYPKGAVEIDISYDTSSSLAEFGFQRWRCVIAGAITVRQGVPASQVWATFLSVVNQRLDFAKNARIQGGNAPDKPPFLVTSWNIQENIYGLPTAFSMSYMLTSSLDTVLSATGMWQPTKDAWSDWKTDVQQTIYTAYGVPGLKNLPNQDAIVNVCASGSLPVVGNVFNEPTNTYTAPKAFRKQEAPSASYSWLGYTMDIATKTDWPVVRHRMCPKSPVTNTTTYNPADGFKSDNVTGNNLPNTNDEPATFQKLGGPNYDVVLYGGAVRVGHQSPVPGLLTLGGVNAIEVDREIVQGTIGNNGVPVFGIRWAIYYVLEKCPIGVVKYPPNFMTPPEEGSTGPIFTSPNA